MCSENSSKSLLSSIDTRSSIRHSLSIASYLFDQRDEDECDGGESDYETERDSKRHQEEHNNTE
jgi:hypothetical protein